MALMAMLGQFTTRVMALVAIELRGDEWQRPKTFAMISVNQDKILHLSKLVSGAPVKIPNIKQQMLTQRKKLEKNSNKQKINIENISDDDEDTDGKSNKKIPKKKLYDLSLYDLNDLDFSEKIVQLRGPQLQFAKGQQEKNNQIAKIAERNVEIQEKNQNMNKNLAPLQQSGFQWTMSILGYCFIALICGVVVFAFSRLARTAKSVDYETFAETTTTRDDNDDDDEYTDDRTLNESFSKSLRYKKLATAKQNNNKNKKKMNHKQDMCKDDKKKKKKKILFQHHQQQQQHKHHHRNESESEESKSFFIPMPDDDSDRSNISTDKNARKEKKKKEKAEKEKRRQDKRKKAKDEYRKAQKYNNKIRKKDWDKEKRRKKDKKAEDKKLEVNHNDDVSVKENDGSTTSGDNFLDEFTASSPSSTITTNTPASPESRYNSDELSYRKSQRHCFRRANQEKLYQSYLVQPSSAPMYSTDPSHRNNKNRNKNVVAVVEQKQAQASPLAYGNSQPLSFAAENQYLCSNSNNSSSGNCTNLMLLPSSSQNTIPDSANISQAINQNAIRFPLAIWTPQAPPNAPPPPLTLPQVAMNHNNNNNNTNLHNVFHQYQCYGAVSSAISPNSDEANTNHHNSMIYVYKSRANLGPQNDTIDKEHNHDHLSQSKMLQFITDPLKNVNRSTLRDCLLTPNSNASPSTESLPLTTEKKLKTDNFDLSASTPTTTLSFESDESAITSLSQENVSTILFQSKTYPPNKEKYPVNASSGKSKHYLQKTRERNNSSETLKRQKSRSILHDIINQVMEGPNHCHATAVKMSNHLQLASTPILLSRNKHEPRATEAEFDESTFSSIIFKRNIASKVQMDKTKRNKRPKSILRRNSSPISRRNSRGKNDSNLSPSRRRRSCYSRTSLKRVSFSRKLEVRFIK